MTQEDKNLLLKDLCARLPYGVKVQHQHQDYLNEVQTIEHISRQYGEIETESVLGFVDDFKPYLRPMSSMTDEEKKEYAKRLFADLGGVYKDYYKALDYLHTIHVDYRGLIEKGLAIAVTEENNPYKE